MSGKKFIVETHQQRNLAASVIGRPQKGKGLAHQSILWKPRHFCGDLEYTNLRAMGNLVFYMGQPPLADQLWSKLFSSILKF